MSFYRITWHREYEFATLHNYGCTFKCCFCSYKLRSGAEGIPGLSYPKPQRFLSVDEMKEALFKVKPKKVYFMGGEPTTAVELPEMLAFAKEILNAETKLGHTNGSELPLLNLDGANVGFKAWDKDLHQQITGRPKMLIYDNFQVAWDLGMNLSANMVFIPEFVGLNELEGLARFLGGLSRKIPFHIMGYIPVPGQPWRRPTTAEMHKAAALAHQYLDNVDFSHLTSEDALDLSARDNRFQVEVIAGS